MRFTELEDIILATARAMHLRANVQHEREAT